MSGRVVSLPKFPNDYDFEDYIAAFFQIDGHFIEKNIVNRHIDTILELDITCTNYLSEREQTIQLIEIKSGSFGYEDVFKVCGWMRYLNISNGIMIAKETSERCNSEKLSYVSKSLNIDLIIIPNEDKCISALSNQIDPNKVNDVDFATWRFSYLTERKVIEKMRSLRKQNLPCKRHKLMRDYYSDVNNNIFFIENILLKLNSLYLDYYHNPKFSARCGNEMIGNPFEAECNQVPTKIFRETYYQCLFNDIQISTYIEHRSRLAILKNAVDYLILKNNGENKKIEDFKGQFIEIDGIKIDLDLTNSLPKKFLEGLEKLETEKYFFRYPVFWQWFLWIFGGFILKDYEKEEYALLSQKTGVPVSNIPDALKAYDKLFPNDNGWFFDISSSNIRQLKMFPVPFKGVGANYRRLNYSEKQEFDDLSLTGLHTRHNLLDWNNATIDVLTFDIKQTN